MHPSDLPLAASSAVVPRGTPRLDVAFALESMRARRARRIRVLERRSAAAAVVFAVGFGFAGPVRTVAVALIAASLVLLVSAGRSTVSALRESRVRLAGHAPSWSAALPSAYLRAPGDADVDGRLVLEADAWRWFPADVGSSGRSLEFSRSRGVTLRRAAGRSVGHMLLTDERGSTYCFRVRDLDECARYLDAVQPDLTW